MAKWRLHLFSVTAFWLIAMNFGFAAKPMSLEDSLARAYERNPELAAVGASAEAEKKLIASRYSLSDPRIGLMREANMNLMEQQMGPMTSWSISQELMFPAKYFVMGFMQRSRASAADEQRQQKRLEIREQVIGSYYELYALNRIVALLESQRETLREIARIAEARRATGAAPQQDEIKAHLEQTRHENEILLFKQELYEAQAKFAVLLDDDPTQEFVLPREDLKTPLFLGLADNAISKLDKTSRTIRAARHMEDEAEYEKGLAKWGYVPDFMLTYRRAFVNSPPNAYFVGVEASIPLWFFTNQSSKTASASARAIGAEKERESVARKVQAEAVSLGHKVETYAKLLQIFETALIPQATGALNSSRAAYSTGKTSFIELLDSERSLYAIRIAYFEKLAKYVASLAAFERIVGVSLSSLPFGENL